MKLFHTALLTALLASSLSFQALAAESADDKQAQIPAQPAAPSSLAPELKPAEKTTTAATRLGHVDIARIAAESARAKAEKTQVEDLKKKLQGQIEVKRKQLEKLQASLEAKLKTLTPAQREAKAKEFQKKVEEFQKFGMNAEKELQARQEELTEKLFKTIEQASIELGKAKGLSLVIIKRELLYLASGVEAQDVTEDIIKMIDKK